MHVSLDTNVFISASHSEEDSKECVKILNAINNQGWECGISVIVIAELLVGAYKDGKPTEAELLGRKIQELYHIHSLDLKTLHIAAQYRVEANIKLPDALIVGSAISHSVDCLISRDIKIDHQKSLQVLTPREFVRRFLPV